MGAKKTRELPARLESTRRRFERWRRSRKVRSRTPDSPLRVAPTGGLTPGISLRGGSMGGGPHGTLRADRVQDWGMGVLPLGRLHLGPCQWKLCKEPGIRFFPVDLRVEVRFGNRATRTSHSASGGRSAPSQRRPHRGR